MRWYERILTELDLILDVTLGSSLAVNLQRLLATLLARSNPRLSLGIRSLSEQVGNAKLGNSKRTILGQVLVVHNFEHKLILLAVNLDVRDLVPVGIQVVVDAVVQTRARELAWKTKHDMAAVKEERGGRERGEVMAGEDLNVHLSPSDDDTTVQHPRIGITFASSKRLNILQIPRMLKQHPHNTNRRSISSRTTNRTSHQHGLPFSRQSHTTRTSVTEREPILSLFVGFENVGELDFDVSEFGVGDDRVVVDHGDSNHCRLLVGDEELGWSLPNGVVGTLERLRTVDRVVVESDLSEGVDLLAARVELLGLVDDETDDSRSGLGDGLE